MAAVLGFKVAGGSGQEGPTCPVGRDYQGGLDEGLPDQEAGGR